MTSWATGGGIGLLQATPPGGQARRCLYLNDGIIQLEVLSVTGNDVACKVVDGGELRSRKGLNLPGIDLGIAPSPARPRVPEIRRREGIDAVSQSFVESGADIARSARRPRRSAIVPSSSPRSSARTPWSTRTIFSTRRTAS